MITSPDLPVLWCARALACLLVLYLLYQRGLTGEMSKYMPFLHSESSHSLPTQPTDTILALNES